MKFKKLIIRKKLLDNLEKLTKEIYLDLNIKQKYKTILENYSFNEETSSSFLKDQGFIYGFRFFLKHGLLNKRKNFSLVKELRRLSFEKGSIIVLKKIIETLNIHTKININTPHIVNFNFDFNEYPILKKETLENIAKYVYPIFREFIPICKTIEIQGTISKVDKEIFIIILPIEIDIIF